MQNINLFEFAQGGMYSRGDLKTNKNQLLFFNARLGIGLFPVSKGF